jgi:tetratricopeptide (TPR) repeat protein
MLVLTLLSSGLSAAVLNGGLEKGKDYYFGGDFKQAIAQFEFALKADPGNAEVYLWLGKAYAESADLRPPVLSSRARLKAKRYFAKAVQLAPESGESRRELLNLLIGMDYSPSALREAKWLVESTPKSDPEYLSMKSSLDAAENARSYPEFVGGMVLSAPFEALARVGSRKSSAGAINPRGEALVAQSAGIP